MAEKLQRDCPLTESRTPTTTLTRYSKDGWLIKQCSQTGFVFLENPPVYEAFEEDFAWQKTIEEERRRRKEAEPVFSVLSSAGKRLRHLVRRRHGMVVRAVKIMHRLHQEREGSQEPLRFVDVGCADAKVPAETARILQSDFGIKAIPYGVEISKELAVRGNELLAPFSGGVAQGDAIGGLECYEDDYFDYAIMCAFLEHEIFPMKLLRTCHKKLRTNGLATIKVPNFASLNRKIRQEKWCGFRYPDHVNYFTPQSLKSMVEACGFRVAKMGFFDRLPTSDNMWCLVQKA